MLYLPRESGQGLVEYAMLLVFIAIAVVATLALLGPAVANLYGEISTELGRVMR